MQDPATEQHIQEVIDRTKAFLDAELFPILRATGEPIEGNVFMLHHSQGYTNLFQNKCKNLVHLAQTLPPGNTRGMEIGFNAGFSTVLMLFANPQLTMQCFDLGEHRYTQPCFEKIQAYFGADRVQLILGDSTQTVPLAVDVEPMDLIHIDGGHAVYVAESDIQQSHRLSKPKTIFVFDDYDFPELHGVWDNYVAKFGLVPPKDIFVYPEHRHDVKQRI